MFDLADTELIIFDCDGVLVDTEPLANEVLSQHASAMGWTMDGPTSMIIFRGMTMSQVHARIENELGQNLSEAWIDQYYDECFEIFKTELTAVDGATELVKQAISLGRKICVASQGPHRKMQLTLAVTGLREYFDGHIFSAHDVARPKPFPDLFLHAAHMMKTRPDRCCVIEDSLTGVRAALAANMKVIHLTTDKILNADNIDSTDEVARVSHLNQIKARLSSPDPAIKS